MYIHVACAPKPTSPRVSVTGISLRYAFKVGLHPCAERALSPRARALTPVFLPDTVVPCLRCSSSFLLIPERVAAYFERRVEELVEQVCGHTLKLCCLEELWRAKSESKAVIEEERDGHDKTPSAPTEGW